MSGRRTRLCILNPFGYAIFDPAARASKVFGGAEVQLYYLSTTLAARDDFEVSMIVERPACGLEPIIDGVHMIGIPSQSSGFTRFRDQVPVPSPAYLAAMRRAAADVYLQRGAAVLTGDVAFYCRLARRSFLFMAAHDWDCDRSHQRGRHYLVGSYYISALHAADLVYTQSDFQSARLAQYHGIAGTVRRTVYPPARRQEVPREHVLWAGRCLEWKRPMTFLDLAECRPDTTFAMACPAYNGARELHRRVKERAERLTNVRFLDFVPFASMDELFRTAHVLVNSSTVEGFPNTFVQAARTGTPVLSLEVNPDGVLERNNFGTSARGDPQLLAKLLDGLLDDPARWQRQSAGAYRYFEREHDMTMRTSAIAEDLLRLGRRSGG